MNEYNLAAIRGLLKDAFTAQDLWRFCQERPAFSHMTTVQGKALRLLPSCILDDVLLSDHHLQGIVDPTGLFLNSLLVPAGSSLPHEPLKVRFAHRTYQEFFLALNIKDRKEQFMDIELPEAVLSYVSDLESERLDTFQA